MLRLSPEFITPRLPFLNPDQFATLCNDLLASAARTAGIPVSHLSLNLRIRDPDGGLDARCENAPLTVGQLIPSATCGHQFKSGNKKRSAKEVATEDIVDKPRVMELLAAGHSFIYLAALDHGDEFEKDVTEAVQAANVPVATGQIRVISGHSLAHQILSYPAIVARFVGLDVELEAFATWSSRESMSNPYRGDGTTNQTLEDLRRVISQPGSRLRVVGSPGDGKTRTVLEALRGTDLEATVLYADQADNVTPPFVGFLQTTADVQCTLVIDEVDEAASRALLDRYSAMRPGVRLILIGIDASARPLPNNIKINGLSQELLVAAIEAIVPGIPRGTSEEIARVCENSPKLAVLIAKGIQADPALANHHERLANHEIQGVLENYLDIDDGAWKALSGVALLERLGWTGEAESESVSVFGFLGLNPMDARKTIDDLHRRYGIAPIAGRFRYVSPQILADHLAARQLSPWTADHFRGFIAALTTPMAESFARRLRGLSAVLANRATVEEVILGAQGPFRTVKDVEDSEASFLLRYLAGPFRHATLRALRRVVDTASDADLRSAERSRRDLVWALEELLWPEDTFVGAARLLLRLAVNETETYGNNATGIFTETFQIWLGRTAAGPEPRLQVLHEAIASPDARVRKLAAKTLGKALTISHISRMGVPPKDVSGMPTEAWQPATYGDIWRMAISLVTAMRPLLQDADSTVRSEAADALGNGIEAAIKFPGMLEAWLESARLLVTAPYEIRKPVLSAVEWRLDRETLDSIEAEAPEDVKEEQKAEIRKVVRDRLDALRVFLEELKGTDFSSRFRWVLSTDPWKPSMRGDSDETRAFEATQDQLAAEVIANPELFDIELEWLNEVKGHLPEVWIERLAAIDTERRLWDRILAASRKNERAIGWVSLYELAQYRARGQGDIPIGAIDDIARQGAGSLQAFDLLVRAGYSSDRLTALISLFRDHAIGGQLLRRVTFSTWRDNIPLAGVEALIEAAIDTAEGQDAAVSFLSFFLHFNSTAGGSLGAISLRLLELTAEHKGPGAGSLDEWAEVAKHVVSLHPAEITRVVLHRLEAIERFHTDQLNEILKQAWEVGDKIQLFSEFYAPRLESHDLGGWRLRMQLEHFPFQEVGDEHLLAWVADKPDKRAHALAQIIGRPLGRPSNLHAALLERFPGQGVGDAYLSDLISGTWWGSAADRTRGLIDEVRRLLDDDRPSIREWARGALGSLEQMLKVDELHEAEERFR